MSFELVCESCGAASGPSTGVCPFCKTVLSRPGRKQSANITELAKLFADGKIPAALAAASLLLESRPKLLEDADFLILCAKIYFEAEAPSSKVAGLLNRALLAEPGHREAADYLELIEAKRHFTSAANDDGETRLQALLRRSPDNVHALFALATHLFWVQKDQAPAARLLEKCVRLRPGFLRAWGCLGMLYQASENAASATMAFRKCVALETEPQMKAFFQSKLKEVSAGSTGTARR
jgi:hypothetical protein